jgi:hypothetical protein
MLKLGFHGRSAVCPKPQRVAKLDRLKKNPNHAVPALRCELRRLALRKVRLPKRF